MRVEPPTSTISSMFSAKFRVAQRLPARFERALDQIVHQLFELGARQGEIQVLRP
jgi:hypothetical protein